MKKKQLRFIAYFLTIGIIGIAVMAMAACSSTSTSTATSTLSSIAVTPASPANLVVGSTQQFTATGTYSDGSTADITSEVTWESDTPTVATIDSTGLATGVAAGTSNITTTLSGITSPAVSLTVVEATSTTSTTPTTTSTKTISSIAITPTSPASLAVGSTQAFTASGTYSDGSTADITSEVTWASDTNGTATIDSTGLATGVAAGTANISATLSGITSPSVSLVVVAAASASTTSTTTPTTSVTTSPITLSSITVTPASPASLAVGSTQQFIATAMYSDGSTANISSQVTWASDTVGTATISAQGLATGIAAGTANITAVMSGLTSQPVILTVTSP